jgi:hypothetical protein
MSGMVVVDQRSLSMTADKFLPETRIARLIREEHLERTVATGAAIADVLMAAWRALRPAPAVRHARGPARVMRPVTH